MSRGRDLCPDQPAGLMLQDCSVGTLAGALCAPGTGRRKGTVVDIVVDLAVPVFVLAGQVRAKPLASFKRKNLVTSLGEMASFGE
jgi:hypothetical protein